jgi:chitinase
MRDFLIIGYLPDYRQLSREWGSCLTDIIYFSAEPRADGRLDTGRLNQATLQGLRRMKRDYGLRILISIGGWERSAGFGPMVVNPAARRAFLNQLLAYSLDNELDGADFDWEFPENADQFKGYVALLTEMRAAFRQHNLLVSVTLSPMQNVNLKPFEIADRVQVMSYDRGPRHSTYDQAVQDLALFVDGGIPADKLILGLPFYGRDIADPNSAHTYQEITDRYQPSPGLDEAGGIYFNGIATIQKKTCYARQRGFSGVMIWELGQDTAGAGSLLQAAHRAATRGCAD